MENDITFLLFSTLVDYIGGQIIYQWTTTLSKLCLFFSSSSSSFFFFSFCNSFLDIFIPIWTRMVLWHCWIALGFLISCVKSGMFVSVSSFKTLGLKERISQLVSNAMRISGSQRKSSPWTENRGEWSVKPQIVTQICWIVIDHNHFWSPCTLDQFWWQFGRLYL